MLTATKSSHTTVMIFCKQEQSQAIFWWRNVDQDTTYNSPCNIILNFKVIAESIKDPDDNISRNS